MVRQSFLDKSSCSNTTVIPAVTLSPTLTTTDIAPFEFSVPTIVTTSTWLQIEWVSQVIGNEVPGTRIGR